MDFLLNQLSDCRSVLTKPSVFIHVSIHGTGWRKISDRWEVPVAMLASANGSHASIIDDELITNV